MKSPDTWERDEWITLAVALLFAVGAYKTLRHWAQHTAAPWMLHHRLLLAPGQGMVQMGRYGSVDLLRIVCAVLTLAAVVLVAHLAVAAPIKRTLAQRRRTERDTNASS